MPAKCIISLLLKLSGALIFLICSYQAPQSPLRVQLKFQLSDLVSPFNISAVFQQGVAVCLEVQPLHHCVDHCMAASLTNLPGPGSGMSRTARAFMKWW
jgi:hypothetical protein